MLVTVVIVAAGMVLAFWAGSRWRHHARARSDYRTTAASLTGLRRLRRATFRAALVALAALAVYLAVAGATALRGDDAPQACKSPGTHPLRSMPACPASVSPAPGTS